MRSLILFCIFNLLHCLFVANAKSDTEIDLKSGCYDIVLSNDGSMGYITGSGNGCIILVDFSQQHPHALQQINISELRPFCLKLNPIRNELYVTGKETNNLYAIDLSQIRQYMANPYDVQLTIHSIPVGNAPRKIAVSSDGKTIFVCTVFRGSESISVIDAENKQLLESIPFDEDVDPLGMTIAQNKLYIVDEKIGSNKIYVFDIETYSIIKTISVEDSPYDAITSNNDSHIYISHDSIEGMITVIDPSTDTVEKSISMGGSIDSANKVTNGMTIKNNILYAVNSSDKSIGMINILTNQLIKCALPLKTGFPGPTNLSASLDGNQLYIVHPSEQKLTILDIQFTCPLFKTDLTMDVPNDKGIADPLFVLDSEICENQPLTLTLSVDKPDLFKTKPYFSKTAYLTYETNEIKTGIATIDMTLRDSYGKCSDRTSFTINLYAKGPVLKLEKTGFGQVKIDDGYFETCLPCSDCNQDCQVLPPVNAIFPKGSKITLTAIPNENWCFKNWSGAANVTKNPIQLELYRDLTRIKAIFANECIPTGYAIIIQGRNLKKEGEDAHRNTTDYVYDTFTNRGFMESDIKYLRYDNENNPVKDPKKEPTLDKIQDAITVWALDKMNKNIADLYIVIVGHGNEDQLFFDDKTLSSSDLKQYLNVFDNVPHANIVVVIGACNSGSFIDDLSSQQRIIITSSKADENSNKGKSFGDQIIQEGDYFIYHFFNNVNYGDSIRESFKESSIATSKYFDNQHPLLDDNHDGFGSFDLLSILSSEGEKSKDVFVGEDLSAQDDDHLTTKFSVLPHMILDPDSSTASFVLDLGDTNRFDRFWIDVKSKRTRSNSDTRKIKPRIIIESEIVHSSKAQWDNIDKFNEPGKYQVLYFAKETASDHVLLLREKIVYKNKNKTENQSPGNFSILAANDTVVPVYSNPEYAFPLDWTDTIEPDNDRFTYSVFISKNEQFNDAIRIQGVRSSLSMIHFKSLSEMGETYYFKVKAIDQYGAMSETSSTQLHVTSPNNMQQGWLKGYIVDNQTQLLIGKAKVFQLSEQLATKLHMSMDGSGKFIGYAPLGTYTIKAAAEGYVDTIKNNVSINKLWPDNEIIIYLESEITEEILILKYLAGIVNADESVSITKTIDISNDGKIGLEEAIYYQPCSD